MHRLVASLAFVIGALAADWSKLQPQGYVSDFAHVVDPDSKAAIERYLTAVQKATGAQIAIVTIPSLDGDFVEGVANQLYRQFGVGVKGKNEGALFLLVTNDRKSRLEVGYGLEPIVPDGVAGDILRSMRPALRAGQYGPALIEAARVLGTKVASAKNVTIEERLPPRTVQTRREEFPFTQIVVILGVLLLFSLLSRSRRGYGGPWIFPGGGGGFSAGGSGGASWGGFGGGDSGGGGASSDW